MKQIELTKGHTAIVDDIDYSWLSQFKWFAIEGKRGHISAARWLSGVRPRTCTRMHNEILGIKTSTTVIVDHKNRNPLDYRRDNLIVTNKSANALNTTRSDNASFLYYNRSRDRWVAFQRDLTAPKGRRYIGTFKSKDDAISAQTLAMEAR
jgi:hypothetical protein